MDFPILLHDLEMTGDLAHVRRNDDGSLAIHHLEDHLRALESLAGEFTSVIDSSDHIILDNYRCSTW